MSNHPRQNRPDVGVFLTTRTRNSELWFRNNPEVEHAMLGYTAKYSSIHEINLYAFAIEGNHTHHVAMFPKLNCSDFMRDVNACTARAVNRLTIDYPGGSLWARRFSGEILPAFLDIEDKFFYTVLQCVQDGLVDDINRYPGYNCFNDAIWGIEKDFRILNWTAYNEAKRRDPKVKKKDFIETYKLRYTRLPGYEQLSQKEYAEMMQKKLIERQSRIVQNRLAEGKGFLGAQLLLKVKTGSRPKNTKTSARDSYRPRIICHEPGLKQEEEERYWQNYFDYKEASKKYRAGDLSVTFPPGMNRPYIACPAATSPP